ncbi:hypothetical protein [Staphylococcus haemolyticus]|uniref:hypothetical protein n=1 Tax=Staphylococcus haemolyticus TaxID=1283 RepID=UPI001F0AC91F|nr:hypothetical protein [Staphylococcus haemolyticus]MCH4441735.1 hypothetical protein [Staphylococcus haemolyticus]
MTNQDTLENMVKVAFGDEATVLDNTDRKAIIRFEKCDAIEYAVLNHNFKTLYNGKYFSEKGQSREAARNKAWKLYESTIGVR